MFKWPHPIEAESHLVGELSRGGIEFKSSGSRNLKLNCPFPHENGHDTGYHLEITKDGRKAHCWVCDWSGSWNKLAKELGLAPFNTTVFENTFTKKVEDTNVFSPLASKLSSLASTEDDDYTIPTECSSWKAPIWRGLSRSFLRKIPSYLWPQPVVTKTGKSFTVDRILWPYLQHNRLMGYVGRRLDSNKFQKYYRVPGCDAKRILFPFDYVRENFHHSGPVVLVEGEVDALNLLQHEIPCLSILGSNNWSDEKRDTLLSLGFDHVWILMDPDPAGRLAARKIKPTLVSKVRRVDILSLSPDDDPGSLDSDQLSWLKNHVFQKKKLSH